MLSFTDLTATSSIFPGIVIATVIIVIILSTEMKLKKKNFNYPISIAIVGDICRSHSSIRCSTGNLINTSCREKNNIMMPIKNQEG